MSSTIYTKLDELTLYFQGAIVYLESLDTIETKEQQCLFKVLGETKGVVMVSGGQWQFTGSQNVIEVSFPTQNFSQRRLYWQVYLQREEITLRDRDLNLLSSQFALNLDQIARAVKTACNQALWRAAEECEKLPVASLIQPTFNDLLIAARKQSDNNLAKLAHKVKGKSTWEDIILPCDQLAQLKEISSHPYSAPDPARRATARAEGIEFECRPRLNRIQAGKRHRIPRQESGGGFPTVRRRSTDDRW